MERAVAYAISAALVGIGVLILVIGLSSNSPALWAVVALVPITIGIVSAFGPVIRSQRVSSSAFSESGLYVRLVPDFCRHTRVSHFVSMLLLALALTLTVCFGVAAWRLSAGK